MKQIFKTAAKWILSLLIGGVFIWYAAKNWPLYSILGADMELDGAVLVASSKPMAWFFGAAGVQPYLSGISPHHLEQLLTGEVLWSLDLRYLGVYFVLLTIVHFLRVLRWRPLLKPIANVGFWKLNRVGAVGFMSVFLFPFRLGELVRPLLIQEQGHIKKSEAFAGIVVERVMDGLVVTLMLFAALALIPVNNPDHYGRVQVGSYVALAVFLGAITFLALSYWKRELAVKLVRAIIGKVLPGIASKVIAVMESFLGGLAVLPDWKNFLQFVLVTCTYWSVSAIGYNVLASGFGFDLPLTLSFAMMASVVVGMMIPNAPGNVGSFWVFFLMPLGIYSTQEGDPSAIAYALCAWGSQLLQFVVFAGYFLLTGKVSFKDVAWASSSVAQAEAEAEEGSR